MKNTALFCLIVLSAISSAQVSSAMLSEAGQSSSVVHELFTNWQALSVMAIMLSAMLVAIAYMLGIGFEIPGLRAWAGTELGQVIASVLILVTMMAVLAMIDAEVSLLVNSQVDGMVSCKIAGEPCLKDAATFYLNGYIDSAKASIRNLLIGNMDVSNAAAQRSFYSCYSAILPLPCLQYSSGWSHGTVAVLQLDTNQVLYEYYSSMLSSMEAQKAFVEDVCFKIAPFILATGIVARTFFATRKLGGLLIAGALALMFVLPMMYIFDWMTLNSQFTSDKTYGDQASLCPDECQLTPPLVYDSKQPDVTYSQKDLYNMFYYAYKDPLIAKNLTTGKLLSYDWTTKPVSIGPALVPPDPILVSCEASSYVAIDSLGSDYKGKCAAMINNSLVVDTCGSVNLYAEVDSVKASLNPGQPGTVEKTNVYVGNTSIACPYVCRELPYPYTNPFCEPPIIQRACAAMPPVCKISRKANAKTLDQFMEENLSCVQECKIVPPLKDDCNNASCLDSRFDCRISKRDDLGFRTPLLASSAEGGAIADEVKRCDLAKDCPADLNASKSCVYVLPADTKSCADLCPKCPAECRIAGDDPTDPKKTLPNDCYSGGQLITECSEANCPESCKIPIERIIRLDPGYKACNSTAGNICPWSCRVGGVVPVPDGCDKTACDLTVCSGAYKETVPSSSCQKCLDVDANFQFDPPVMTNCADFCAAPKNPAEPSTAPLTMEGFVGGPDYRNIAQLLVQAYLLPLFNFTVAIMFIQSFSGMLGGDIEIPGITKVL